MTCSSSLAIKNAISCLSFFDVDGLQVQHGDGHTGTPGSAAVSSFVSESRAAFPAQAQHDYEYALATAEYDSSDDVCFMGTSVQLPSLGEGGGAGKKRQRENARVPTVEEGKWKQEHTSNNLR